MSGSGASPLSLRSSASPAVRFGNIPRDEPIVHLMIGGRVRDVDASIAPIVKALNDAGIATVASCSGHGHQPGNIILADGRELLIAPDFDTAREVEGHFPGINGEPPRAALVDAVAEWRQAERRYERNRTVETLSALKFAKGQLRALFDERFAPLADRSASDDRTEQSEAHHETD